MNKKIILFIISLLACFSCKQNSTKLSDVTILTGVYDPHVEEDMEKVVYTKQKPDSIMHDGKMYYRINVDSAVNIARITATPEVSGSKVSGEVSNLLLQPGLNRIELTVTAQDQKTVETHLIVIVRNVPAEIHESTTVEAADTGNVNDDCVEDGY